MDVVAGVGLRKGEGGLAGSAVTEVFDRATSLVMVVAEALAAHGRASAAAVFGADVAAAEGGGRGLLRNLEGVGHGYPLVSVLRKIFKIKDMASDHRLPCRLKCESPAMSRAFSFSDLRLAGCVKDSGVEKGLASAILLGFGECRYPRG